MTIGGGEAGQGTVGTRLVPVHRRLRWTRPLRILGGFLLAAMVGVTLLPAAALLSSLVLHDDAWFFLFYLFGIMYGFGYAFGIMLSGPPMLVWVVVSEALRLRAPWWHVAAGGAVGALAWFIVAAAGDTPFDRVGLDTGIAGLAAGAIYWLIAGHSAGDWTIPAIPAPAAVPTAPDRA